MRIVKKFIKHDEKSALVSRIFDECLLISDSQFLDRIDFYLGKEEKINLILSNAYISLDYNNPFIQSKDERAIRIIILNKLLHLNFRRSYNLSYPIEDILVNREIIKRGYGDDLFYYYYLFLLEYKTQRIKEMEFFLKINTTWLSFFPSDNYYSAFLRKMINSFKYRKQFVNKTKKLFLALKKDLLKDKNLEKAMFLYNELGVSHSDS